MNMHIKMTFICCILLAACSQGVQPTETVLVNTATPSPRPSPEPTLTPQPVETEPSEPDQEWLIDEWRIPFENATVLFSACTFMFETHANYQQGEIDLATAKEELSLAADFIGITEWFFSESYRSEASANLMLDLELNMRALIEWYDATADEDIGTQATLDALFPICETAQTLQTEVVFTAMDAGLTEESIDQLDHEQSDSEIFREYYDKLMYGD